MRLGAVLLAVLLVMDGDQTQKLLVHLLTLAVAVEVEVERMVLTLLQVVMAVLVLCTLHMQISRRYY